MTVATDSRSELLDQLVDVLHKEGFGRLCSRAEKPRDSELLRDELARDQGVIGFATVGGIACSLALVTAVHAPDRYPIGIVAPLLTAVYFVVIFRLGQALSASERAVNAFIIVLMMSVPVTFGYQILVDGYHSLLLTHGVPLWLACVVGILGINLDQLRNIKRPRLVSILDLVAAAPLLVAIALIIAVVPLFSEDLWQLADEIHLPGVVWLGGVTVLPMTAIVLWYLLVTKFDHVIGQVSKSLQLPADGRSEQIEATIRDLLAKTQPDASGRPRDGIFSRIRARLRRERPRAATPELPQERMLKGSFGSPAFPYYVRYMRSRLKWILRRQIGARVLVLIAAIALGFATYVYTIAWIVVSAERARLWTGRETPSTWDAVLGITMPYGPHIWVALVMAVVATAILLALVVTTSEMDTAFVGLATHGPLKRCMSLAVPVAHLWSDAERGATQKMEGASGSEVGPRPGRTVTRDSPQRAITAYEWTPAERFHATIDTTGSACHTLLAVYMKSTSGLRRLDVNTEADGRSRLSYETQPDCDYVIVVDAFSPRGELAPASVRLNWMTNDQLASAQLIEGASGTVRGSNFFASKEDNEPNHAGKPGGASVWYRWKAPATVRATVDTAGSTFHTLLAVYVGDSFETLQGVAANDEEAGLRSQSVVSFDATAGTEYRIAVDGFDGRRGDLALNWGPPANDDLAAAETIEGVRGTVRGNNTGASRHEDEPHHAGAPGGASVWYGWTAPKSGEATIDTAGSAFDTLLAVYTGSTVGALRQIVANDDVADLVRQSRVRFDAVQGEAYLVAVDGYRGDTGEIVLNWHLVSAPPNDAFDDAERILGRSGIVTGQTIGAARQATEPEHAGQSGGSSVWYRWTAEATGEVTFDTWGSAIRTLLAVYTGTALGDLSEVASAVASEAGASNRVAFRATSGVEYHVAVDGYQRARGDIVLSWGPPAHDDLENAEVIAGFAGTTRGNNAAATRQPNEPYHADKPGGVSVWYRWTAPGAGIATIDTAGSTFDTVLAVYTGTALADLSEVASNDDAAGITPQSRVELVVTDGTSYLIAVDGFGGATGDITLSWRLAPGPNARLESAEELTGERGTVQGDEALAEREEDDQDTEPDAGSR